MALISLAVDVADAAVVIAEKKTVDIRLEEKIYNVGKDAVRGGTARYTIIMYHQLSVDNGRMLH
jgi:hypothetical protein